MSEPTLPPPARRMSAQVANLSPAYFGLAMATGIVSLAAHLEGFSRIATALFGLNVVLYAVLWLLTLWRLVQHPRRVVADLFDHLKGPGFFTTVAATGVLGSQVAILGSNDAAAMMFWALALVLWVCLTYAIFAGLTIRRDKPGLAAGISGAWLLAVVATQSIALSSALLAVHLQPSYRLAMNFLALSTWLAGGMLYIWTMSLIFYRYTFLPFSPHDFLPPYWINMGAMAISTLAGSSLIVNATDAPLLRSMLPFLEGFTVLYWATGTWWIPLLVVLMLWRHVVRRVPLQYDPLVWGAVFPLGMYSASTHALIAAMGLPFLAPVPRAFFWIALIAWLVAFIGLARDLFHRLRTSAPHQD